MMDPPGSGTLHTKPIPAEALMLLWLDDLLVDLRLALRSLARTPGFTSIALLVIAAGIGVNTAVFSVVNTVLLKPLTHPDRDPGANRDHRRSRPGPRREHPGVQRLAPAIGRLPAGGGLTIRGGAGMNLTGGDHPEQVRSMHVTSEYFSLFGAPLVAGRVRLRRRIAPGSGEHSVVLSYGLWQRRFGGNPGVVGTTIQLYDQSWLVVGVIGRGFITDSPVDFVDPFSV
ncbi:MAG: ABC transporter permease [Pirellulales bacterium]